MTYIRSSNLTRDLNDEANQKGKNSMPNNSQKFLVRIVDQINMSCDNDDITACILLDDTKVAFVYSKGKKLVVYGVDKKSTQMLPFALSPKDVLQLHDFFVAVTTFLGKTITIVRISEEIAVVRKYQTPVPCYGIDYYNGVCYACLSYSILIQVMNDKGETFIQNVDSAFYSKYSDQKLICSNHLLHKVFCISMSGTKLWECNDKTDKLMVDPLCLSL